MGKSPKMPENEQKPPPVRPEDESVQQAGQRKMDEIAERSGRGSTFFADPTMRTGYAGYYNQ